MYQVGIYARLSKEDGDNEQSESIENQVQLIKKYLEGKKEFHLVNVYIDDGYSGLSYENRPAFLQMLSDIHSKTINTIITKDMSRLGRESIETSIYIEKIFPQKGVRYISVLDNYDSYTGANTEIAPFKILLNDMYSKDISKKVRGSLDTKRKNGLFIGSSAPYGYIKSKTDHNYLEIDEEAAVIVKEIFSLYIKGYGKGAIATKLEKNGVLPPSAYKKEVLKENYFNPNIKSDIVTWSAQTIHQILTNEVYLGNMVQKKFETISYKVRKKRNIPKEEQIRVLGTHEPIIDKHTFDTVQEIMKNRSRSLVNNQVDINLFAGKLECAECGHLFTKIYNSRKKEFDGYVCSQYKRHGNLYCSSHLIKKDELETIVLDSIKKEVKSILRQSDIEELLNFSLKNENHVIKSIDIQLEKRKEKINEMKKYKQKAFELFCDGNLTNEDYIEFQLNYDQMIEKDRLKLGELEKKRDEVLQERKKYICLINKFCNYMDVEYLSREMVVELIDKIVIDDKKNMDIYFTFKNNE